MTVDTTLRDRPEVRHRHRLTAARVVGHRHHHQGDSVDADLGDRGLEGLDVHVSLEWVLSRRDASLRDDRSRASAPWYSTLARVVSKCVLFGTTSPGLHHRPRRESARRRVPGGWGSPRSKPGDPLNHVAEPVEGAAAGVGLVAHHHPGPLLRRTSPRYRSR